MGRLAIPLRDGRQKTFSFLLQEAIRSIEDLYLRCRRVRHQTIRSILQDVVTDCESNLHSIAEWIHEVIASYCRKPIQRRKDLCI